jgi:alpha-L-fucosidase
VQDATPFARDPLRELAEACRRVSLPLGVYYSHAQDWNEPGGATNDWDFPPNAEKDRSGAFERYLNEKSLPQLRELLTNYGPLWAVWFDTPHLMTPQRSQRFLDLVHSLQPHTLVNSRVGKNVAECDYQSTGDNKIPVYGSSPDFEVPATVNQSWGFRRDDTNWKSPGEVLFKLVDVVSKGGNFLLNVGPDANGDIPEPSRNVLQTVGRWLAVNGEAIYGVTRSPFGEEFGEFATKGRRRDGRPVFLERTDWRCTTKPGRLYFIIFHAEGAGGHAVFTLPAFKNPITAAYTLDDQQHRPLEFSAAPDGARILLLSPFLNLHMGTVVVVEYAGERLVE